MKDGRLVETAHIFARLIWEGTVKDEVDTLYMGFTEAEAVKMFADTYLAFRVSCFDESDNYTEMNELNSQQIIANEYR